MNIRTKILLAVSAGVVMVGAASGAVAHRAEERGDHRARGEMMFEMLDADKDGKVTRAEAEAFRDQQLVQFDADKDGSLNQVEYTAMVNAMMAEHIKQRFERQDADKSGKLDKTELSARVDRMFGRMDKNGDGAVDRGEMSKSGHHRKHHDGDEDGGKVRDKN